MSSTAVLESPGRVDPSAFIDPSAPQSWSRQLFALLEAGHYREAYEVLAEKVPYVENQLRPYAERLAGRENHWTHTHAWIERLLDTSRPMRILDVGCAVGCHAIEFARQGHQTCGVDILPQMIERGRELAESLGLSERVRLIEGDIRHLERYLEPRSFDAAVACDIFEHLDDEALAQVLAGLRRSVRPGGRIVIQTSPGRYYYWFEPDRRRLLRLLTPMAWLPDRLFTAYVRALDRWLMQAVRHEPPAFYRHEHGHVNCMDPVHLRGLMQRAGLCDVRTFAVHAHPGFKDEGCRRAAWTQRLFGRKSIAARNVFGVAVTPEN
jgi:SAM-dependent methyltransferase